MKKVVLIVISLMLVILTACGQNQPTEQNIIETVPDKNESAAGILESFSATDISGKEIDESMLSDYDLTMVNVWATFCSPCIQEMPELGELSEEYREKGVQIVGLISDVLNSDGSISQNQVNTAQEIINKTNADYLHIIPSDDLLGLLSQISSVPTTFFVDKNGNQVGNAYLGAKSKNEWKSIIDKTLTEVSK